MPDKPLDSKLNDLLDILRGMQSALLAYSGGLDSTLLLKALKLSGVRALAVTGVSETTPPHDLRDADRLARETGLEHRLISTDEMEDENFVKNSPMRCFYCKDGLFGRLREIALRESYAFVLDGANLDDREDYRPGREAALRHGVRSPLDEAGLTKDEIRRISRQLRLSTWDKPASPCLATRFPYGVEITVEALRRVSTAEDFLRSLGFRELRVRDHNGAARLELPEEDAQRALDMRERLVSGLKAMGYGFVCLDFEGFASGSLNRALE